MRVQRKDGDREMFRVVDEAERHYIGVIVGGSALRDGVVILPKSMYEPVDGCETVPDYYTYRAPNQRAH